MKLFWIIIFIGSIVYASHEEQCTEEIYKTCLDPFSACWNLCWNDCATNKEQCKCYEDYWTCLCTTGCLVDEVASDIEKQLRDRNCDFIATCGQCSSATRI